jgi:membrane protein DedA with SNARE-associated domain
LVFEFMLEFLSSYIIHLIQSSGYFGIFMLMTLQSAMIPIPSEVTMPFAGFLVGQGQLNFILVVLTGAMGNLVGGSIAYAIGYFLEENVILNLIKKYGKFLLVSEKEYDHSTHWLQKYGSAVVFFGRMIPGVASFISLPAGIAEIKYWKFALFTLLGSLIWSSVLTSIGVYLGSKWNTLGVYFHKFELIIVVLLVIAVLFYINHKLRIIKFGSPRGEAGKK